MSNSQQAGTISKTSGWNYLIGCWLIASPFMLGFQPLTEATWDNIAVGAAVLLLTAARAGPARRGGGIVWLNLLLGAWMIVSPFAFGYFGYTAAMVSDIGSGMILSIAAMAAIYMARNAAARRQATGA